MKNFESGTVVLLVDNVGLEAHFPNAPVEVLVGGYMEQGDNVGVLVQPNGAEKFYLVSEFRLEELNPSE